MIRKPKRLIREPRRLIQKPDRLVRSMIRKSERFIRKPQRLIQNSKTRRIHRKPEADFNIHHTYTPIHTYIRTFVHTYVQITYKITYMIHGLRPLSAACILDFRVFCHPTHPPHPLQCRPVPVVLFGVSAVFSRSPACFVFHG